VFKKEHSIKEHAVIIVMDYAFGEQAYETMDELFKTITLIMRRFS
jgi:hypothetical protein